MQGKAGLSAGAIGGALGVPGAMIGRPRGIWGGNYAAGGLVYAKRGGVMDKQYYQPPLTPPTQTIPHTRLPVGMTAGDVTPLSSPPRRESRLGDMALKATKLNTLAIEKQTRILNEEKAKPKKGLDTAQFDAIKDLAPALRSFNTMAERLHDVLKKPITMTHTVSPITVKVDIGTGADLVSGAKDVIGKVMQSKIANSIHSAFQAFKSDGTVPSAAPPESASVGLEGHAEP